MSIYRFIQTDITIPQETAISATDIKFAYKFADLLSLHLITFLVFLSLVAERLSARHWIAECAQRWQQVLYVYIYIYIYMSVTLLECN